MSVEGLTFEDWVGVAGALLLLVAYSCLLAGRWRTSDAVYKLANLGGALAVAYSLWFNFNPGALVVEILWVLVTLASLIWPEWADPERRRARASAGLEVQNVRSLLEAAARSISDLSNRVQATPFDPGRLSQAITLELRGIGSTLDPARIIPVLGRRPARSLAELFTAAERALPKVDSAAGEAASDAVPAFVEHLNALARVLHMQREALPLPDSIGAAAAAPPSTSESDKTAAGGGSQPPSESSNNDSKLKPDEAVLLAAVTEKFYGSTAFKVIGGALVAAALLAGAGTVYLGSHTLTLRADLERTEQRGRADIEKTKADVQNTIRLQAEAMATIRTDVEAKKSDFDRTISAGKERIEQMAREFESKSPTLIAQIVNDVIVNMGKQLENPISQASTEIRQKGTKAQGDIDQVVRQVMEPLNTSAASISNDLRQLRSSVTRDDQELQKLTPAFNRLRELGPQLEAIVGELNAVRARQKELVDAVAKAQSEAGSAAGHAQAARQSAALSESARETMVATIRKSNDESADQRHTLGTIAARLQNVSDEIEALQRKVRGVQLPTVDLPALAREATDLLNGMKGKQTDLDAAVAKSRTQLGDAASSVQAAQRSAEQAEKSRTLVVATIDSINNDAGEQKRTLGYTKRSIEILEQEIVDLTTRTGGLGSPDLAPLNRRLNELKSQTDATTKRVEAIEDKLKEPPPSYPKSEAELTKPQVTAIQQRLTDLSFDPKGVDGAIGGNTKNAIRDFQRSIGQPASGTLTASQIQQLLSPLQIAKP